MGVRPSRGVAAQQYYMVSHQDVQELAAHLFLSSPGYAAGFGTSA